MSVYMIASVKVTDEAWVPAYVASVHHIVGKHGGKYLSRSSNITTIEGESPDVSLVALLEFPSMQAMQSFVDDPEYAKHKKERIEGSVSTVYVIDDVDAAGTIPYLNCD